jgi:signal transduction histidine kinase
VRTQLHIVAVEDGAADADIIARHLSNAGLRCVVRQVKTGSDFTSAPQRHISEDSRDDWELRRRLATLEETVRIRTESLDEAIAQLHKQTRLRQAAELELGLARKLEEMGRLAAAIALAIHAPLQDISDSVRSLESAFSGLPPGTNLSEVPGAIERIVEGTRRAAAIVRTMQEFAHPDSTEKAPADLNRAIETTLFVARNEYKHVATVQLHLGEIPEVICDIGELGQVFLNLIVNSAHALADADRDAESGRIIIRTALVDNWVQLQFEDNGCGIPQTIIDRIYDPFFTTKDVGRGSGLAIARAIVVDRHSGRISVDSTPGKGTCFTLRLPVGGPAADR